MELADGTLVTDHSNHQIFFVEQGKLRWVPDAWTMNAAGLSPADLVIAGDDELAEVEVGDPLATAIPSPALTDGSIVETESGVWRLESGQLMRILDPRELVTQKDFDPKSVNFLPDSLVRGLFPKM